MASENLKIVEDGFDEFSSEHSPVNLKEVPKREKIDGLSRFSNYIKKAESSAIGLVKKWIHSQTEESINALVTIGEGLEADILSHLYQNLNPIERDVWKNKVTGFLRGEELKASKDFILKEIIKESITPKLIADDSLVELVLTLEINDAIRFIEENEAESATLLNIVSATLSAKILNQLDPEVAKALIIKSFDIDLANEKTLSNFKETLRVFINTKVNKSFSEKALQMIPFASPEKEKMLYKAVVDSGKVQDAMDMAKISIPSDLIWELPVMVLKDLLSAIEMHDKVELLASFDEKNKNYFLDAIGDKESASREMVELELETYENDENKLRVVKSRHSELWKGFVGHTRKFLKENTQFSSIVENLLNDYFQSLK